MQGSVFAHFAASVLDEMWPGSEAATLELDQTLPENTEMSSHAEVSSHICESFFMSPERSLECEQPVRRIYQSLGLAVDGLLELVLDSTRQVRAAAHAIRARPCIGSGEGFSSSEKGDGLTRWLS